MFKKFGSNEQLDNTSTTFVSIFFLIVSGQGVCLLTNYGHPRRIGLDILIVSAGVHASVLHHDLTVVETCKVCS